VTGYLSTANLKASTLHQLPDSAILKEVFVISSQIYHLRDATDMLIEFSVGNYRSFKEKVTFSMVAANLVSQDKSLDSHNIFAVDEELSLVKSAAIYGANASGKSNLAKALKFMQSFAVNSSRDTQSTDLIPFTPFLLSTETEDQPSFFEIVFLINSQQYRYGFTVDKEQVLSEWLFYVPKSRETRLFYREGDKFEVSKAYKATGIPEKTRHNALFLSVSAQFNVEKAEAILSWFTRSFYNISGLSDHGLIMYTINSLLQKQNDQAIIDLIKELDLGIEGIYAKSLSQEELYHFSSIDHNYIGVYHQKFDADGNRVALADFALNSAESEGTQKIFALASILVDTLKNGKTLVIDEFDARWHPLMSRAIVGFFNSNETNPKNAQLILMTHDTNLLSNKIFRRDQVWFTEKDRYGATLLYSLAEYKVRNDASYGSDYIKGRYGAIPYIQGAESLIAPLSPEAIEAHD
jgi:uncharacterized protein